MRHAKGQFNRTALSTFDGIIDTIHEEEMLANNGEQKVGGMCHKLPLNGFKGTSFVV